MQLAYDIGGYDGTDTARYLSLGYRVVCIEANPDLAKRIRDRFDGSPVTVLNVAVGEREGILPFYALGELGSFERRPGSTEITVSVKPFTSILSEYGIPHFLKVDIEGADRHVILPLTKETAPEFVSFEAGKDGLELILHLHSIGYTRFNLMRQDTHRAVTVPEIGSLAHLRWSARQAARLWLRKHPRLHGIARGAKSVVVGGIGGNDSGDPPMLVVDGWRHIDRMLSDWAAVTQSGIIESAWFDVHARLHH